MMEMICLQQHHHHVEAKAMDDREQPMKSHQPASRTHIVPTRGFHVEYTKNCTLIGGFFGRRRRVPNTNQSWGTQLQNRD